MLTHYLTCLCYMSLMSCLLKGVKRQDRLGWFGWGETVPWHWSGVSSVILLSGSPYLRWSTLLLIVMGQCPSSLINNFYLNSVVDQRKGFVCIHFNFRVADSRPVFVSFPCWAPYKCKLSPLRCPFLMQSYQILQLVFIRCHDVY